jgi:hypothetical protein
MQAAVGRVIDEQVSFPISASDIRKWAQAIYYPQQPPRQFWDEGAEETRRAGGIVAPAEFNPFAWMTAAGPRPVIPEHIRLQRVGPEYPLGIAGPGTRFRLNGGYEVRYSRIPMRPGDVIRSVTTLTGYRERPGRLGLMLFSTTEGIWTNQNDEVVKVERFTLIRY